MIKIVKISFSNDGFCFIDKTLAPFVGSTKTPVPALVCVAAEPEQGEQQALQGVETLDGLLHGELQLKRTNVHISLTVKF